MLLYGKPIAEKIKIEQKKKKEKYFGNSDKYVAILFFGNNYSANIYVKSKKKYGETIGLETRIFGQEKQDRDKKSIISLIEDLNKDEECVGIIVQLPLPEELKEYKNDILEAITPKKDIDGLGGVLIGKSYFDFLSFVPATPRAVLELLDYYNLGNLRNKRAAVVGQSTIVGKPLAIELLKRGAQIGCFDITYSQDEIKSYCKKADYIFSATGHAHLIDETFLGDKRNQIVIDIGYGHKDGKAVGDVDIERVIDKVLHISPVPGGVGPLTIASLFSNVFDLREHYH